MKVLRATRMERCIGCHSCSLACARLVHHQLSWLNAGIRIRTSGGLSTGLEADVCVACSPPPCAGVCPTEALTPRPHEAGGVRVRHEFCIRCGRCAQVCPVEAIQLDPDSGLPYLCIHCGRCVGFCPHQCLELVDSPHGEKMTGEAGHGA